MKKKISISGFVAIAVMALSVRGLPPPTVGGTLQIDAQIGGKIASVQIPYLPPATIGTPTVSFLSGQTSNSVSAITTTSPSFSTRTPINRSEVFTLNSGLEDSEKFFDTVVFYTSSPSDYGSPVESSYKGRYRLKKITLEATQDDTYESISYTFKANLVEKNILRENTDIQMSFEATSPALMSIFGSSLGVNFNVYGTINGADGNGLLFNKNNVSNIQYNYWEDQLFHSNLNNIYFGSYLVEYYQDTVPQSDGTFNVYNMFFWDENHENHIPIGTMGRTQTGGWVTTGGESTTVYLTPESAVTQLQSASTTVAGNLTNTGGTTANYTFTPAQASATTLAYQLKIAPGAMLVFWMETFTPDGATEPSDIKMMSWKPTADETLSPVYTIDPMEANNPHRFPGKAGTYNVVLDVNAELAVDANRDGTIKLASEDDTDATSTDKPFRFWLNDDIDRKGVDPDEPDVEDDDDPASRSNDRDWMRDQIPGKRDLEDFARLWVYTQGLNSAFKSGEMKLGLKWGNVTSGAPAIKLYRAADTDGGTGYLFDPTVAQSQIDPANAGKAITMMPQGGGAATTVIEGANGFFFPKEVFANLTDALPKMYLLFEGCKKGTGQLQLVVYDKNGTKIGEGPGLHLDLKNIKELYERWTVGDGPNPLIGQKGGGDPGTRATISSDRLPSDVTALQYGPQQTSDDKNYILFVHGWNVAPWLKDAWAETTFKRLYWQGYKGRFGAFQWPTTYHDWSVMSVFDYDLGEYTAWRSAQPLADLLVNLNGSRSYTVSVLAHSMGNVVAGEALQVTGRTNRIDLVANYVATQAAVPGHCFDRSLTGGDLLTFGFLGFGSASTPNIYRDWFYLSSLVSRAQANFYNVNDYALSAQIWQLGQTLKPDKAFSVGGVWFGNGVWTGTAPNQVGPSYGYSGDPTAAPAKTGFFKTKYGSDANGAQIITGTSPLNLEDVDSNNGSVTNLRDRYEIMAFASQPRSKALGGVAAVAGFAPQNLGSLWKPDTFPQTNGPYSAHPWHSAQFRFTNADQANYWNKFMKKLGLPTTQ